MSVEDVQNATTYYQGISMSGKLTVANDVSLNSKLSVASDVSFGSKLFVQGTTINNSNVSMNANLFVGGNVTIGKKLFVNEIYADNFTISGNVTQINVARLDVSDNLITLNKGGRTSTGSGIEVETNGNVAAYVKLNDNNKWAIFNPGDTVDDTIVTKARVDRSDVSLNIVIERLAGNVVVESALTVASDLSMNGNLSVGNSITNRGTLLVDGITTFNNKLFVTNDASLNAKLFIGGDASLNAKLFVSQDTSMNGNLAVSKNIVGQGTLGVTGITSLSNNLFVGADASLNAKLFVSQDTSMNGNLAVSKNIVGQGTLTVTGNTSLNSRLTVTSETTLNSGLGVALDSSFNNKLFVAGNLTVGTSGAPSFVGIGMDPSSNYRMNVNGIVNATGGVLNNGIVVDGPTGILSNDVYENYCSAFSLIKANLIDDNSEDKLISRVAMSSDGKYITLIGDTGLIGGGTQGFPLVSSDYGKTFQEIETTYASVGAPNLEMSASGKFQYYVGSGMSTVLRSNNYGINWSDIPVLEDSFLDVAVSSSGQYVVVTRLGATLLSNDYGVTFTTLSGLPTTNLKNNAISSSGQIIVVTYLSGVYVSTNFGISWKQTSLLFQNTHLSMSSTGQYILVIGSNSSRIYQSSDYGTTFVQITGFPALSPNYSSISANGQYQIISHANTGIYSSVDYGKTWVLNTNSVYRGIAMTSNGRIVVSLTDSGAVMSTNYSTEFADRFKYDVSLNARLRVALDSSFNANLFVGGSIVNTGLTSALGLKAPLAAPSFTGLIVSAGDVSLNSGLRVASDSSFNANLFVGGSIVNTGLTSALGLKAPLAAPSFTGLIVSAGDISLNARLSVASDSSFNANLFVGGSIVNTGLTSALGLKAPLAAPSFTGLIVSAGDVSMNARLSVASDSSFNANLFVGGSIVNTGLTSALGLKAPLESPTLTGTPLAPTASAGTNTTQIATTQYVRSEISALVASAPAALDTLNELALALGNDAAFSTTVTNSIGLKAPSASPSFTGTFLVSSADASFNGNVYVAGAINNTGLTSALGLKAPLASPSFTGAVISAGDVSLNAGLSVASDSSFNSNLFVGGSIVNTGLTSALGLKAPLAAPSFTGTIVSAGDVSLNAGLRVASDSSFNANLFVGGSIMNTGLTSALGLKAPLASPSFTGAVISAGDVSLNAGLSVASDSSFNSNLFVGGSIVNTGLTSSLGLKAPLASPSFTGAVVSAGDVSLNAGLSVASDSSFNTNLFVGGSIVNTGLTSSLGLKAPLASPSFTGAVVSAGDVSLNARLSVASDSSFNANLFVGGSIVNTGLTSALGLKAPLASPALTGEPTAPTAASGTNTTQIATTQYVRSEISLLVASAPETLDTLKELATALGNDAAFSTTVTNSIGLKAPSASPSFTGTFLVSSADASFNGNLFVNGSIVNTGLTSALALKAPLASPSFTGLIVSAGDVSLNARLSVASDSSFNANLFVGGSIVNTELTSSLGLKAPLAAPSFTGLIVSAGDVSLNSRLSVASDSSFNANLFVGGSIVNTELTSALALKAPLAAPSFTGAVISDGDVSLNAGLSVASDSSFNNKVFVKYLTNSFIVSTGASPGLTVTFPISRSYLLTDAAATNVIIILPTLPTSTETYIVTFKRTVYNVAGTMTFTTGGVTTNTQLIYPSQTSLSNGSAHTQISGSDYTYNNTNGGSHPYNAITLMGVNNGTVVGWFEI